jgi:signal transduction histidine kinase
MQKAVQHAIDHKAVYHAEYRITWPDHSTQWILASGKCIYNNNDEPVRMVGVTANITESKSLEEELERRVKQRTLEYEQSNTELEQFAYVASHDLQEPLRKIRTFIELLSNNLGDINDKSKSYMNRIHSSAERMMALINDLLNFSQLSKGGETFITVNLNDILNNVKNDFELLIEQKNAVINSEHLPQIQAVPLHIYQLFSNLISNALKFSTKDKAPLITITSANLLPDEVSELTALNHHLPYTKITFTDNGIGFAEAFSEKIFTIFQRLNDKHTYSGTGIGLALCKKIVNNHQGIIYAQSKEGYGATFTLIMPLVQGEIL